MILFLFGIFSPSIYSVDALLPGGTLSDPCSSLVNDDLLRDVDARIQNASWVDELQPYIHIFIHCFFGQPFSSA